MSFDDDFDEDMDAGDWGEDWQDDEGSISDTPDQTIKQSIRQRVERDLKELRLINPLIDSSVNWGGGSRICFRIGLPVNSLGLNIEQARAWSLVDPPSNLTIDPSSTVPVHPSDHQSNFLFIELALPTFYFHSTNHGQVKLSVGTSNNRNMPIEQAVNTQSTNQSVNQVANQLNKCKLSWPLTNQLTNNVLPSLECLAEPSFEWDDVDDVMEACFSESSSQSNDQSSNEYKLHLMQAIQALNDCKSVHAAIEHIANNESNSQSNNQSNGVIDLTDEPLSLVQSVKRSISQSVTKLTGKRKSKSTDQSVDQSISQSSNQTIKQSNKPSNKPSNKQIKKETESELHVMEVCSVSLTRARRALKQFPNIEEAVEAILESVDKVISDDDMYSGDDMPDSHPALKPNKSSSTKQRSNSQSSKQSPKKLKTSNSNNQTSNSHSIEMSQIQSIDPSLVQSINQSIVRIVDPINQALASLLSPHNFLIRMCLSLINRLIDCSSVCLMCSDRLAYAGLNLSVCDKSLCRMSYEKLGVGFDIIQSIKQSTKLFDLYLTFFYSASVHQHLPFVSPLNVSVIDRSDTEHKLINEKGELDFARLNQAAAKIPSVEETMTWIKQSNSDFYEQTNKLDPLISPLIRWLYQSNPSYLRELEPAERFASIPTEHQFVLLMSSPEKEADFQRKKAACPDGSIWAWHGSPLKNWHSIMRTGLRNLSGTKLMANGAAYGSGIYMAEDAGTSLGYSGYHQSTGWSKSSLGANITALALVEVVASAGTFKPFLVVTDESLCTTRYLFIFDQSVASARSISTKAAALVAEMKPSLLAFDPTVAIHSHKS